MQTAMTHRATSIAVSQENHRRIGHGPITFLRQSHNACEAAPSLVRCDRSSSFARRDQSTDGDYERHADIEPISPLYAHKPYPNG
jgi:hypothetical protein